MGWRRRRRLLPLVAAAAAAAAVAVVATATAARAAAAEPRPVDAVFHTSFVDVVWEPAEEPAAAPAAGSLPEEHFDVAVVDVYFDRPLFLEDGGLSLADLQQFLRTHRNHRQALYGVARLECPGNRTVESFPAAGRPEARPHQLFPLPSATDSEFRWLNAVAGDYAYRLDSVGYRESNRVSFAVLLRERDWRGRETRHLDAAALPRCRVEFSRDAGPPAGWPGARTLRDAAGRAAGGGAALRRAGRGDPGGEAGEAGRHFHLVERGKPGAEADLSGSFAEIPFKSILEPAIVSSAGPDDPFTKLPVDFIIAAMQDELMVKVAGGVAGSTAPGAVKVDGPGVYGASFLEMYDSFRNMTHPEGATFAEKYQRFLEVHATMRVEERATPADDVVDGKVTTDLIKELVPALTTELSVSLTESLTASMQEHVHDMLAEQLSSALERDLTVALAPALIDGLSQALEESVSPTLDRLLIPALTKSIGHGTIETVTRALTHTIGGTLTFTTKQAMMLMPYCSLCRDGEKQYCAKCRSSAKLEYETSYYLDYYSCFYGDYYSDLFGGRSGAGLGAAAPDDGSAPTVSTYNRAPPQPYA